MGIRTGKLIVLEGADGSGKSTHAGLLAEYLEKRGYKVVLTQEPTNGFIGQAIRMILSGRIKVSPETLTLLFTADRAEHVDKVIRPALENGGIVISDRYYYSTIAYQSVQGVSDNWISQMNSFVPEPDLVIVLEVASEKALARMSHKEKEVFEVLNFQKKVQKKLLSLAYGERTKLSKPGRIWKVISNAGRVEHVQKRIQEVVDTHL